MTGDVAPEVLERLGRGGDSVDELRVLCPGGRRADHVTGHAEELLTIMRKACLLQYVLVNRRKERFNVALRADRVVIRWNEELVCVVIIAVRVMAARAGHQLEGVPVVVGPDEVGVLLMVRLRIEGSREEARWQAIDALGVNPEKNNPFTV